MKKYLMFKNLFIFLFCTSMAFAVKAQDAELFEKELRVLESKEDLALKNIESLDPKIQEDLISDSVSVGNAATLRPQIKEDEEAISTLINQESPPAKKSRRIRSR